MGIIDIKLHTVSEPSYYFVETYPARKMVDVVLKQTRSFWVT
jgi:hypothetical protein